MPPARRAERGAEHARRDPDPQRRARRSPSVLREEVERGRDEERGADRLDAARADEHVERRREPAGERRRREDEDAGDERLARPAPRHVRRRHGDEREHEVEGRENPRDRRDPDVELARGSPAARA